MTDRTHAGLLIGLLVILGLAVLASIFVGANQLSLNRTFAALAGNGDTEAGSIVWQYRIPRTVVALAVGSALGVSGAIIQAYTRNPLADPGIMGINAGAAFAVTLTVGYLGATSTSSLVWAALIGALLATLTVTALGAAGAGTATPVQMTLAGVALAAVLTGITAGIRLSDPSTFDRLRAWAAGSVAGRSLADLAGVWPFIVGGFIVAIILARPLNALALGDEIGTSLGVNPRIVHIGAIMAIAVLAGAATALAGPILFIGLMVPHVCRWIVGPNHVRIIPASALCAAGILLFSDVLGRLAVPMSELPVGVVTAFVGAPVLIALVRRKRASTL